MKKRVSLFCNVYSMKQINASSSSSKTKIISIPVTSQSNGKGELAFLDTDFQSQEVCLKGCMSFPLSHSALNAPRI